MKSIYIIRHAKSSWANFNQTDFERPLNERGKKDAPLMAERLKAKGVQIDAFISSPAVRALTTCEYFCGVFDVNKGSIICIEKLYHAQASTIDKIIDETSEAYNAIAIFTHNPGITDFVNSLLPSVKVDNMPTCGIFAVESPVNTWIYFKDAEKKFLFFDYPKSIQD